MYRTFALLLSLLAAVSARAAGTAAPEDMKYVYEYGDALYSAYQGDWFDAIARLDASQLARSARSGGAAPAYGGGAGPLVGDFELNYRMDNRAGRAIEALIENTGRDDVRNEALYRLARMYFRKDQLKNAVRAIERVRGVVPDALRPDLAFLRANIYLAVGRNAEAVAILKGLQDDKKLAGFASYNLAIALLRTGDEQGCREYLDRTGRIESDDRAELAIKDKANLVLGESLLAEKHYEAAKQALDRVRLAGSFSNRALLSSGWADASQDRFEQALVPWTILVERTVSDPAVQEALLDVPYAYSRIGVYSTSALKYEAALKAFGAEIAKLDASIASIRRGTFATRLLRVDLRRDADWADSLRNGPDTPETSYLLDLMASNDFQASLRNYLDLAELRKKLDVWSADLVAYEEIMRLRRAHYEPLLPFIDRQYAWLEAEKRREAERRNKVARKLDAMQASPQPDLLVASGERRMIAELALLQKLVTPTTRETSPGFLERLRRLRGVMYWNIFGEYDKRYAVARDHLRELDRQLDRLSRQLEAVAIARRTAVESYTGHDDVIRTERLRIADARQKVLALTGREGQVLEIMAANELSRRRERLDELRVKARFGLADSYDRAGKTQGRQKAAP